MDKEFVVLKTPKGELRKYYVAGLTFEPANDLPRARCEKCAKMTTLGERVVGIAVVTRDEEGYEIVTGEKLLRRVLRGAKEQLSRYLCPDCSGQAKLTLLQYEVAERQAALEEAVEELRRYSAHLSEDLDEDGT
ncbi:hypothetical protein KBB60_01715 [Patescibacteria group bacterium]|nr:hypothetical protein [Patescibacteria group bacterium]